MLRNCKIIFQQAQNTPNKIPPRFSWAATIINPQPTDTILEVGCGAGILAELLANSLSAGTLHAVDRSAAMIASAQKRNSHLIKKDKINFIVKDYLQVSFPDHHFDKIVAFNVSGFWLKPEVYLSLIRKHLKPGGKFFLLYQPPYDKTKAIAEEVSKVFEAANFKVQKVLFGESKPAPVFCIISRPDEKCDN